VRHRQGRDHRAEEQADGGPPNPSRDRDADCILGESQILAYVAHCHPAQHAGVHDSGGIALEQRHAGAMVLVRLSPVCITSWIPSARRLNRRRSWRSFEALEFARLEWGDWFNNRRLLEPIGNILPAEAEERYYGMLDAPAVAA
jgi:transposase InsO family protein